VEIGLCQRYYAKSYPYSIIAGTVIAGTAYSSGLVGGYGTTANMIWTIFFPVSLRIGPTGGTHLFTYGANSGGINSYNLGGTTTNYAVSYLQSGSEKSMSIFAFNGAANNYYYIQYSVDVEM
jgi:hypothetical protein